MATGRQDRANNQNESHFDAGPARGRERSFVGGPRGRTIERNRRLPGTVSGSKPLEGRPVMTGRFGSVVNAMATPFRDDFSLDLDRAQELASWLLDHGSDALVVFGSTGEPATLPDDEERDLLPAVKEATPRTRPRSSSSDSVAA